MDKQTSRPNFLLSVDPGKATGICLLDISAEDPVLLWSKEVNEFDLGPMIEELLSGAVVDKSNTMDVVVEKFTITPQTGKLSSAPWSLEHIGVVRFLCAKYGAKMTLQTPADAKNFVTNERLHALEIWHRGGEGHAIDALRHAVLYMVRKLNWRPAKLLDS